MNYIRNLLVRQILWMTGSDSESLLAPADADPRKLYMEGMTARLFNPELFEEPYEEDDYRLDITVPQWYVAAGTLEQKGGACRLLPAGGGRPMAVHPACCSRLRDWGSSVVLLFDGKNPETGDQILVTEEEYSLADPFPVLYDKAYMLLEYLRLDPAKQEQVRRFLTEEDCAEAVFATLRRLALTACQTGSDLPVAPEGGLAVVEAAYLPELLGASEKDMKKDLNLLCVLLAVCHLVRLFEEVEGSVALEELMCAQACCHHPAFEDCVERTMYRWEADNLAKLLLSVDSETVDAFAFACVRFWLFALLKARICLVPGTLEAICRSHHFRYPMTGSLLRCLRSGLFCDNAKTIRACVEQMYPEEGLFPVSGLPGAQAVIRIHDLGYKADAVEEEAQRLLLGGSDETETVLGIAMLSVYLQFRSELIRSHREPVVLSCENQVTARVLQWLQNPWGVHYPYACELACQLYLSCGAPEDAFADPQVVHMACVAWNEHICPTRVEKLLSTLPLGMELPSGTGLIRIRRVLKQRFDNAMMRKVGTKYMISLFRCCAVLGCWKRDALRMRFRFLLRKIDGDPECISWENREYMRRLDWDMLRLLILPTGDPPAREEIALPKAATEKDARSILPAFRQALGRKKPDLDQIAGYFRGIQLDPEETSLIVDWFYALCTLGLSQEAEALYLRHKDILDRPWIYQPDSSGLSVERPYHAASCFWNGMTRREKGLELAAGMGHPAEQWSLAQSCEQDYFRRELYVPKTGMDRSSVLKFFQLQHRPGRKQSLNYWMTHYEDETATRMALREPGNHGTVLLFGYCSSKDMVLAAVQTDPSHVCYASKALLKDDRVALAVLEQSCRYLHLLFAPVTQNRAYIKMLIWQQGEPVVLNRTKEWIRDDKELMLASLEVYPQYFELVSERLRGDREVVLSALQAALRRTAGTYWLRNILCNIPQELQQDPEILQCLKKWCAGEKLEPEDLLEN